MKKRREIFKIHLKSMSSEYRRSSVNVAELARQTDRFAGANIEDVVDDAVTAMGLDFNETSAVGPSSLRSTLRPLSLGRTRGEASCQ
jgi:hypothetical protein